ncbi:MAG: GAF domain-containing protein [Bacteroidales bacterium]
MQKEHRYQRIITQLNELLQKSRSPLARMATISAVLHHKLDYFFWTGFYLHTDGQLVVGPYQGPVACLVLQKDTGVCWHGFNTGQTVIVPDVHLFPGHIACDSRSRSEIVVPVRNASGQVTAVLDVDSRDIGAFDETDARCLEQIVALIYS